MTQHPRARAVALARSTTAAAVSLLLVLSVLVLATAGRAQGRPSEPTGEPASKALGERADTSEYGMTSAKNGVLRRGCRNYHYTYSVNPPDDGGAWALETFVVGPGRVALASGGFLEGFNETSGRGTYRLCRPSTRPGVFKIKAKLSSVKGNDTFEVWLPVTRFRLRAPR